MLNHPHSSLNGLNPYPQPVVIRMEEVSKVYGMGNTEVHALNGVDLIVEQESTARSWGHLDRENQRR